jgi:hypothetical protein
MHFRIDFTYVSPEVGLDTLDPTRVRESLSHLGAAQTKIFGANGHRFLLDSPLAETDVVAFEQRHNIRLPADYRGFLTSIGNGGAGPFYGVFPLGMMDGLGDELKTWSEEDGFVGVLSKPFPHSETSNDLRGKPSAELAETDDEEYWRQVDRFEEVYFASSLVDGALPICHLGCALRIWLVVTGKQAGRLWRDGRADCTGLSPLRLANGGPATFSLWYREWLEVALQKAELS